MSAFTALPDSRRPLNLIGGVGTICWFKLIVKFLVALPSAVLIQVECILLARGQVKLQVTVEHRHADKLELP